MALLNEILDMLSTENQHQLSCRLMATRAWKAENGGVEIWPYVQAGAGYGLDARTGYRICHAS
jgi:hypothetical protein